MEQFGLPKPIIRLISRYILDFNSDDIVAELLKYHDHKLVDQHAEYTTPNIIYYELSGEFMMMNFDIIDCANARAYELFIELISQYDSTKYNILRNLVYCLNQETVHASYKHLYMDLNLFDAIAIQACVIAAGVAGERRVCCARGNATQQNSPFLDDFVNITNSRNSFSFRCYIDGVRHNPESVCPAIKIATRDVAEYFAMMDDVDSMNLICGLYDADKLGGFIHITCMDFVKRNHLPKLAKYIDDWLENHEKKLIDDQLVT